MQLPVLSIGVSEALSLTTTAVANTVDANRARTVLYSASVASYVDTKGTAAPATGVLVPANFPILLNLPAGQTLSAVAVTGTGLATVSAVHISS